MVSFSASGHTYAAQTVRLATLEWSPYISTQLPAEGYVAEVIRAAFERSGYKVAFYYMPWDRAVKAVLGGQYDGLTPAYKTRAEENSASNPFPGAPLVFAQRRGRNIEYDTLKDLRPYKIAVVRGFLNTPEFDAASYLQKSVTNEERTGYRRLLFGRVDLWLVDKFVAQTIMHNHLPERAREIEFIKKPLSEPDLYIGFTKSKPYCATLTEAFNAGLEQVLTDGTLEKILKRQKLSLD
jgi:polar amino acid transport system substrate-binding protein